MIDLDLNVFQVIVIFFIIFFIQLRLVWKELQSLFDPMFYFVLTTSFALTFTFLYLTDIFLLIRVFVYFACFWVGYKKFSLKSTSFYQKDGLKIKIEKDQLFAVLVVLGVLSCLLLNIYAWALAGIPLFSDNPSLQKSESLNGGLGYVRRFDWGMAIFVFVASLYWYIYTRGFLPLMCLLLMAVVSIMGGAKSAFLPVLFGLGLYIAHPFLDVSGNSFGYKIKKHTWKIIAFSIIPVVAVFLIESDGYEAALIALVTRLLYFGDTMIFWSNETLRVYFTEKNMPQDYPGHFLNSILGLFRIIPYQTALGNQFVHFTLQAGDEFSQSLGPNTPFYVKGELFFGFVYAMLYSFCIGGVLSIFRRRFFLCKIKTLSSYSMTATLAIMSMAIPTEDSLFVAKVFDFLFVYALLYVVSKILILGGVKLPGNFHAKH